MGLTSLPRCRDNCWRDKFCADWYVPWCPHSEVMTTDDEVRMKKRYSHGKCVNWLRICKKTGKVVVHNKKCDVPKVIAFVRGKTQ